MCLIKSDGREGRKLIAEQTAGAVGENFFGASLQCRIVSVDAGKETKSVKDRAIGLRPLPISVETAP